MIPRSLALVATLSLALSVSGSVLKNPRCDNPDLACKSLWSAISCNRFQSCLDVWEKRSFPQDQPKSEICDLCKEMVKEARDQFLSNETQEEFREVLEGSCDILVPIDGLNKICKTLMDEFINQAVDMIVARLDPTAVCTISGICAFGQKTYARAPSGPFPTCDRCAEVVSQVQQIASFLEKDNVKYQLCKNLNIPKQQCEVFDKTVLTPALKNLKKSSARDMCQRSHYCGTKKPIFNIVVPKDDLTCEFCEAMVQHLKDVLSTQTTRDEFHQALTNFCELTGSFAEQCQKAVDQYFDTVYDFVLDSLNPPVDCALVGICNSTSIEKVPAARVYSAAKPLRMPLVKLTPSLEAVPRVKTPKGSTECTICKYVADFVETALKNQNTEAEIIALLDKACGLLPPDAASICDATVKDYVPDIIQLLVDGLTPDVVCSEIGLCSAKKPKKMPAVKITPALAAVPRVKTSVPTAPTGQISCAICQTLSRWAVDFLTKNSTEAEIEAGLHFACNKMPNELVDKCNDAVGKYVPLVMKAISEEISPETLCAALQFCPESSRRIKSACDTCNQALTWVYDFIGNNRTREMIKVALDTVCPNIPVVKQECVYLINEYTDEIVEYILKDSTPEEICSAIGLCRPAPKVIIRPRNENCVICQVITNFIYKELEDNRTEQAVISVLGKICKIIPTNNPEQCVAFIANYFDMMVDYITKNISPTEVCQKLDQCSSLAVAPKGDNECAICEMIVMYVEYGLDTNTTENAIIKALDEACNILPIDKDTCRKYVNQYTREIVPLILAAFTPDQICSAVSMCPTNGGILCNVCETGMNLLINEIVFHAQAVMKFLDGICVYVPANYQQTCRNAIDEYAPQVINIALQLMQPGIVCYKAGFCGNGQAPAVPLLTHKQQPTGSSMCTVCETVFQVIEEEIRKNEDAVVAMLETACTALPQNEQDMCKTMIDSYGKQLIDELVNILDPDYICVKLGICDSAKAVARMPCSGNGTTCEICKTVVQTLEDEVRKNEDAVIAELDQLCSALPTNDAKLCKLIVESYGVKLIEELLSTFTPDYLCTKLHICDSTSVPRPPRNNEVCDMCESAVGFVRDEVEKNEATIISMLQQVCESLPQDQDLCKEMINDYAKDAIDTLINILDPSYVCTQLHLCSTRDLVTAPKAPQGLECFACKEAVGFVISAAESQSTQASLIKELDKVCVEVFSTELAPKCQQFVANYTSEIIDDIFKELTAQEICTDLGYCSSSQVSVASLPSTMPAAKLRLSFNKPPTGVVCELCESAAKRLEDALNSKRTKQVIESVLLRICSILPAEQNVCTDFVTIYTNDVIQFLVDLITPEQICQDIKLCAAPVPPKKLKDTCDICVEVVGWVETQLSNNATEAEILSLLGKVCDLLPVDATECRNIINTYGDMIITMIIQSATPDEVCAAIGLCSSKRVAPAAKAPPKPKDNPACSICQEVVTWVEDQLSDDATEEEVLALLDKVCDYLPFDKTECVNVVNTYGDMAIQMIIQNVSPDEVCTAVKLCAKPKPPKSAECAVCQAVAMFIDDKLGDNRTIAAIESVLDTACKYAPIQQSVCENFINTYTNEIIQYLLQAAMPDTLCEALGFCTPYKRRFPL